jgi:hypothetical protein
MKLAFRCPRCKAKHTVDQTMFGKKAKCDCGAVLAVPEAPSRGKAKTASKDDAIQVSCPSCGVTQRASAAAAGKRARCSCGAIISIPSPHTPPTADNAILVTCPGCGVNHQAGTELAGRTVRCNCGTILQVPVAVGEMPQDLGGPLDELSDDDFGLAPLSSSASSSNSLFDNTPEPKSDDQVLAQYLRKDDWKRTKTDSSSRSSGGAFAFEANMLNSGVLGGCLAMLIATVWFVVGLAAGWIYFYPPVLFVIGLIAFLKGLLGGD